MTPLKPAGREFPPAPAVELDLPDVAEAFPEDTPAMAAGDNLPENSSAEENTISLK